MTNSGDSIIELKFDGNNINPSTVKPSEIAKLLESFEKALLGVIAVNNPEIKTDALLFSFQEIDNKSLDLKFIPRAAHAIVISSYLLIANSVKNSNFISLPANTINALKEITKFSKRHKCYGYFNHNKINIATFTPETEINLEKGNFIKGETTVYGRLIDVGGENPNVHFKINDDYTVIFDVTEELAKMLAPKLYYEVGLKGTAKWDSVSYQIVDFRISDVIEYEPKPINEIFNDLRNTLGKYWDKVDDINTYLG